MNPPSTRRSILHAGAALISTFVAGCSQLRGVSDSDGNATSDPDDGTDSYGIDLNSQIDVPATVELETEKPFGDEPIWTKEVTLEPDATREFHSVLTDEHGEQAFSVELLEVGGDDDFEKTKSDGFWITPGAEDAPDVTHFEVVVYSRPSEDSSYNVKVIDPNN